MKGQIQYYRQPQYEFNLKFNFFTLCWWALLCAAVKSIYGGWIQLTSMIHLDSAQLDANYCHLWIKETLISKFQSWTPDSGRLR